MQAWLEQIEVIFLQVLQQHLNLDTLEECSESLRVDIFIFFQFLEDLD